MQSAIRRANHAILRDKNCKRVQVCTENRRAAGGGGAGGHRHLARITVATGVVRSKRDCCFRAAHASILRMSVGAGNATQGKHEKQQKGTDH